MTKTTAYLVIGQPGRRNAPAIIRNARKKRPNPAADEIAVKVVLDIPWEVWTEFIPEVTIEVTPQQVVSPVVGYAEDAPEETKPEGQES